MTPTGTHFHSRTSMTAVLLLGLFLSNGCSAPADTHELGAPQSEEALAAGLTSYPWGGTRSDWLFPLGPTNSASVTGYTELRTYKTWTCLIPRRATAGFS